MSPQGRGTGAWLALAGLALAAVALSAPTRALAQGCVIARQSVSLAGVESSPYLEFGDWQATVGYRWFRSDRHFVGTEEQRHRTAEGSQVINDVQQFDLDVGFGLTRRLGLFFGLPYLLAERSSPVRAASGEVAARTRTAARGAGDLVVGLRSWLLDPDRFTNGNLQLSMGLKLPTGADNLQDSTRSLTAAPTVRTVDQSIQPGDGGFGLVVGLQSFARISLFQLYLSGNYLINPRVTNGVPTYRGRLSEAFMSVPDAYIVRTGTFVAVPWIDRLAVGAGLRAEGVPAKDLIGESTGFRRPGYTLSVEPGLTYAPLSNLSLSASVPVALRRNRTRSVSDMAEGGHGDAAFADYSILLGLSFRPPSKGRAPHDGRVPALGGSDPMPAAARAARASGLKDLGGGNVELTPSLGRRLTVVNLWASWCAPCRKELPALIEVNRRFRDQQVRVVGIAVKDQAVKVKAAIDHHAIDYPVLLGDEELFERLGADTVPTTFILDDKGRTVEVFREPVEAQRLVAALEARLAARTDPGTPPPAELSDAR